jgi:hypothetical protein
MADDAKNAFAAVTSAHEHLLLAERHSCASLKRLSYRSHNTLRASFQHFILKAFVAVLQLLSLVL